METQSAYDTFLASIHRGARPPGDVYLAALWLDGRGDWNGAHDLLQDHDVTDVKSARVHAYLHRKEGDLRNAAYWYRHAGVTEVTGPLDEEWATMVHDFLQENADEPQRKPGLARGERPSTE